MVEEILGPKKFVSEVAERVGEPGVATGLAWTAVGGDILFIEATKMPGKGKLTLTGQLGDVMKESVTAALSFVRGRAAALGLDPGNFLENTDLHVHVPAGAVPKDGPSAGVTMYTALVSLFTGVPVRPDVAMTGEITLRGNVLQIGGVKEKLLAAHRAGIKRVIIPDRNVKDLIDVPEEVKKRDGDPVASSAWTRSSRSRSRTRRRRSSSSRKAAQAENQPTGVAGTEPGESRCPVRGREPARARVRTPRVRRLQRHPDRLTTRSVVRRARRRAATVEARDEHPSDRVPALPTIRCSLRGRAERDRCACATSRDIARSHAIGRRRRSTRVAPTGSGRGARSTPARPTRRSRRHSTRARAIAHAIATCTSRGRRSRRVIRPARPGARVRGRPLDRRTVPAFVERQRADAMIADVTASTRELPRAGEPGERRCSVCGRHDRRRLRGRDVDRCAERLVRRHERDGLDCT